MRIILLTGILMFFGLTAHSQDVYDLQKATIKVAASAGKPVVSISSVTREKAGPGYPLNEFSDGYFRKFFEEFFGEFPEREYKQFGLGSGVIIDKAGYILTNEHVIDGASEIQVKLSDGREFSGHIKGADKRSDLAIIKIDADNLPAAKLGDSENLQIGSWVLAVGNPFGFAIENSEPTVTVGVVSALHRYVPALGRRERSYDDLIQTDAAINPGNSGGPLVNLDGEVIGINTAMITTSGGYQGLGFAIAVNKAKKIINKLIKGEKILYGWLGVSIQDLNEDLQKYFGIKASEGVIIVKIYPDSPAGKSGLKEGDLILNFNGKPVGATRDLIRMVSFCEVGATASLKIMRDGKEKMANILIAKNPDESEAAEEKEDETVIVDKPEFRGISVSDITPELKRKFSIRETSGVVVSSLSEGSAAEKSGLIPGDVILKVENKEIKNKVDFIAVTSKIKAGPALFKTNRGFFVVK